MSFTVFFFLHGDLVRTWLQYLVGEREGRFVAVLTPLCVALVFAEIVLLLCKAAT